MKLCMSLLLSYSPFALQPLLYSLAVHCNLVALETAMIPLRSRVFLVGSITHSACQIFQPPRNVSMMILSEQLLQCHNEAVSARCDLGNGSSVAMFGDV